MPQGAFSQVGGEYKTNEVKKAVEMLQKGAAALFVEVQDHLGVALRPELMAPFKEHPAQVAIIEDFAVADNPERGILVADRLPSGFQVDHGKTGMPDSRIVVDENVASVRSAQNHRVQHFMQQLRVRFGKIKVHISGNSAHFFLPFS